MSSRAFLSVSLPIVVAALLQVSSPDIAAGGAAGARTPGSVRGSLVSATELADLRPAAVKRAVRAGGFDPSAAYRGVTAHRLLYRTVDVDGRPTTASGVLALPRTGDTTGTVVYEHGTTTYRPDVASTWRDPYTYAPILMYASAGFASVAPDYLGLGEGKGMHAWMHIASEVTASVDLLAAADAFLAERESELHRATYLTGFSQGASAALGLGRELQQPGSGFEVRAIAPIAGAYAFADAEIPALLSGRVHPLYSVAYTGLLLATWDRLFDIYHHPADVVRRPYAGRLADLFDGSTPGRKLFSSLPARLDQLLTPAGQRLLRHPTPDLSRALRQADAVCRWSPASPVRLLVAQGDEQAHTSNTDLCAERLQMRSDTVRITRLGRPDLFDSRHLGANAKGTATALRWFTGLADSGRR